MKNATLSTVPQLSFALLYREVLTWLLGANPRRITAPLPLVAAFMTGVLWTRNAATCTAIAMGGVFSHDALNRLLVGTALRGLLQMVALTMVKRLTGYLVIDDVVIEKTGKRIPGVAWLHSSSLGKKVLALNVVVLGWTNGKIFVPLTFRFWKKPKSKDKKGRPSKEAFDGTPFKTKLELAVEMLAWARQRGFAPTAVLFDGYYLAKPVLRFLKRSDWHWVSRIKGNRKLKRGNIKFQAQNWAALAREGLAPSLKRSVKADLNGWGAVRIIAVRHRTEQSHRFLVGSNPEWGRATIERLYGYRWDIEVAFRDTKQLAGLGDCQCRNFRAQENHVALVFMSRLFVMAQKQPEETIGKTLNRVNGQSIILFKIPTVVMSRPIKRERRRRREIACHGTVSGICA